MKTLETNERGLVIDAKVVQTDNETKVNSDVEIKDITHAELLSCITAIILSVLESVDKSKQELLLRILAKTLLELPLEEATKNATKETVDKTKLS